MTPLDLASFPVAPLAEKETFSKPGTADVTPSDLKKVSPLVRHYAAMAHPFTACKRDQLKHGLSEDHANRRCAVIKALGGKTKEQIAEELGWEPSQIDAFVAECKAELTTITTALGTGPVQETIAGGIGFMLLEAADADEGPDSLMEADLSSFGRRAMASARTALPDGSFPIPNRDFIGKAVRAIARASNVDAARAHIKRRATALGAGGSLPQNWATAESESELYLMAEERACAIAIFAALPEKVGEAYNPPTWVVPKQARSSSFKPLKPPKASSSSSSSSKYDPSKHPRDGVGQFLRKGQSGPAVSGVQKRLGIKVTGTYDNNTVARIRKYQENHNLQVDGVIGSQTAASLLGKSARKPGALAGGLRKGLQKLKEEEDEQLAERTVHTAVQQRDNGVKSATHSSIRSAVFDLAERTTPTHTVKLPNGTSVKVAPSAAPSYGSYGRQFTVTNGRETLTAMGVEEAADTAKELDSRQPGASGVPVSEGFDPAEKRDSHGRWSSAAAAAKAIASWSDSVLSREMDAAPPGPLFNAMSTEWKRRGK